VKLVTVAGSGLFSCLSAGEDRGDVECAWKERARGRAFYSVKVEGCVLQILKIVDLYAKS
jgi:hypothetical protein